MNYRWKKTVNNCKLLVEKINIREKRVVYLKKLVEYRREKRPIIFMDETYVHTTHSTPKGWSDDSNAGYKIPVSKGKRLIIVHAGNEDGFVKNALLTFESGKKSGDYHNDMNFQNYEKWLTRKLIPNIPKNSVIVIDNAPYHNVEINRAPTSNSRKDEMIKWLSERNISFQNTSLKPELYSLIKLHKPQFKMFKIDSILGEHGHSVLRLPPYHPELNPIEMIWCVIKNRVAKQNVSFSMEVIKNLVESTCNEITTDEWLSRVNHVKQVESDYMSLEPQIDALTEEIVINLQDNSDSDDSVSDSDSDSESDTGDHDISGVEVLPQEIN